MQFFLLFADSLYLTIAHPSQCRDHIPDVDTARAAELAQGQLHEVEGAAHEQEDHHVGDQEGSTTVLVGREGETPNVTESWKVKGS